MTPPRQYSTFWPRSGSFLARAVAKFLRDDVPPPVVPPKVVNRTQKHMAKYALNILIEKFGEDISIRRLAGEKRSELMAFYRDEIIRAGRLKYSKSYRSRREAVLAPILCGL